MSPGHAKHITASGPLHVHFAQKQLFLQIFVGSPSRLFQASSEMALLQEGFLGSLSSSCLSLHSMIFPIFFFSQHLSLSDIICSPIYCSRPRQNVRSTSAGTLLSSYFPTFQRVSANKWELNKYLQRGRRERRRKKNVSFFFHLIFQIGSMVLRYSN